MLKTVTIKNYQSLHEVNLELSPFTVIVGPSSSGKSALTRALKTLAGNARGTAFIEHGQSQCLVAVENDTHRVALTRSTGTTGNEYKTRDLATGAEQKYTKLGGATPPEVSKALKLSADSSQWLAGQFDRPFLLSESGPEVARSLGSLTNVHVIFEAAREANRSRQASSTMLKTRQADLATIKARVKDFTGLKSRKDAVGAAEVSLEQYARALRRREDLQQQWEKLMAAAGALKAAREVLSHQGEALDAAASTLKRADELAATWSSLEREVSSLKGSKARAAAEESVLQQAEEEYQSTLHDMGQCPTCGQTV